MHLVLFVEVLLRLSLHGYYSTVNWCNCH